MFTLRLVLSLTNLVFGSILGLIFLRIFLKMFGANASTPFVNWVYETSAPLLAPFLGMFPSPTLSKGFVIEISALFGIFVYVFIAYLLTESLRFLAHRLDQYYASYEESAERRKK